MKKIALAFLLITILATAGIAQAQCGNRIYDIQTDDVAYPDGTLAPICDVVVTAVRYNGFFGQQAADPAESPNGEFTGIWIYTGGAPTVAVGDVVSVCGLVEEYGCMTEINVSAAGLYGYVLQTPDSDAPAMTPYVVTAAQVAANGEAFESVMILIQDGMEVPTGFDLGYGEWSVLALDGTSLVFDDYWYDFALVMEGQCYNNATGIYTCTFGVEKFEPFADGIPIVNCAVDTDDISLGSIKAMYR